MKNDIVKVTKDGITKEILEKDLPDYIALGWRKLEKEISIVEQIKKVI